MNLVQQKAAEDLYNSLKPFTDSKITRYAVVGSVVTLTLSSSLTAGETTSTEILLTAKGYTLEME